MKEEKQEKGEIDWMTFRENQQEVWEKESEGERGKERESQIYMLQSKGQREKGRKGRNERKRKGMKKSNKKKKYMQKEGELQNQKQVFTKMKET